MNILIVDDDENIRRLLRRFLESDGYDVFEASTPNETLLALAAHSIDLITLDLGLGDESGLDVVTTIRKDSDVPIIIVTGKDDVIDRVVGLELGADDYIAKPFHLREVLARIRSVLRRNLRISVEEHKLATTATAGGLSSSDGTVDAQLGSWSFGKWILKSAEMVLFNTETKGCDLTTTEFHLLRLFVNNPGFVLSRDQIMSKLKGHDWNPTDRVIDNHVARLRKKIEVDPARPQIIRTVRGVGYKFASTVRVI